MTSDSVTIRAGATKLSIYHRYGTQQENSQQYFKRILIDSDPHERFATYPKGAQFAIESGRVEPGMTKEQVIMSLGYPPTHRTASTDANTWTYWRNRWVTYQVMFDASGVVSGFVGNAPTSNESIAVPTPAPTPKPKARSKRNY